MKQKILIITTSLQMGGVERASSNLANEFEKRGFQVYFFCLFHHNRFFQLNENIFCFEPKNNRIPRFNLIIAPFRIRKITKAVKPDTILVFNKFSGALTLLGLIKLNYPVFLSERNSPVYRFPLYVEILCKITQKFLLPNGIIAQTKYASNFQNNKYKGKIPVRVINNIVREIKVHNITKRNYILAVGRLSDREKGFDRLVASFSKLQNKEWKLVFSGGDVISGKELYQKAIKLGIQHRLIFLGKITDLDLVYSEAGIFVLPSRSEGFPNGLVEAMAAGLPCVAFKYNPGINEIIEDGFNGILVEDGNINAFAAKLDFLIENESERIRLGKNARLIKEKLASEVISGQYLDFILPDWRI